MANPATVIRGPDPVETPDLHFKLYSKLKIFNPVSKYNGGHCSLLAVSQYYGLIFVGNLNGFSIIKVKSINASTNMENYPKKNVTLTYQPTHLAVNLSQKLLAVIVSSKPGAILNLYNIESFISQDITPIKVLHLAESVGNLTAEVLELSWQPNSDNMLVTSMSDGSILSFSKNNKGEFTFCTLPNSTLASCFCWSPKGKQLVIGCANGTLSQYKPDLKLVKTLPAPPLFNGNVAVVNVLWISNYQFAVSYLDKSNSETFPVITILNAAKNEPITVINYEDITYSNTFFRNHQIYMSHLNSWNVIFISSANSMEVAVFYSSDNLKWEQWLPGDASRAELPLNSGRQETFPLGMSFDYTSEDTIPWGEGKLPPMPKLLLLSSEGVLCIFNIINLLPNLPQLCLAPKAQLDDSLFAQNQHETVLSQPKSEGSIIAQTTSFTDQQVFGCVKGFTFGSNNSFSGFSNESQNAISAPQVTISIPGKGVVGDIKDVPLLLQQQQKHHQQSTIQPAPQALILSSQNNSTTQQMFVSPQNNQTTQPIIISTQGIPATSLKIPTNTSLFGTSTNASFSFGASNSDSFFNSKPMTLQAPVNTILSVVTSNSSTHQEEKAKGEPQTQTDIFSGKENIVQSTPIKPNKELEKISLKTTTKNVEETKIQSEKNLKEKTPDNLNSTVIPELPAVDDSVYWNALRDEINHFNSELQQLSSRILKLETEVGTEKEKNKMQKAIESLYEFRKDLKETTLSQSNEIHSVVAELMESYAWVEDAKSRNLQRKNPNFIELKKAEELDPISARHMSEISHLKYYIENQLKQLTCHLEKEWMNHQDNYRKDVKNRLAVPPMEEVYRTMNFQLKILNKQRALVEELKEKLVSKKRKNKSLKDLMSNSNTKQPLVQNYNRVLELSKLANNLLQLEINSEENLSEIESSKIMKKQMEMIISRTKKLTLERQASLRDILSERDMVKIRPIKTTFETSSFLRSMALEKLASKAATKSSTTKPEVKIQIKDKKEEEKVPLSPIKSKTVTSSKPKVEIKSKTETEKIEKPDKNSTSKSESPKNLFVFGNVNSTVEKPVTSITPQELPKKVEEKSPLGSLSSIVSSIGKETEQKSKPPTSNNFKFAPFKFQNPEMSKDSFGLNVSGTKPQQKSEIKQAPTLTFNLRKPTESSFGAKTDTLKFSGKPGSEIVTTTATTKPEEIKTSPAISTIASSVATQSALSTFSFTSPTTSSSLSFGKINFLANREQSSGIGVNITSTNNSSSSASQTSSTPIFGSSQSSSTPIFGSSQCSSAPIFGSSQSSSAPVFGSSVSIFSSGQKNLTNTFNSSQTTSVFGAFKTETVTRPPGSIFTQMAENKEFTSTKETSAISKKSEIEQEEINVVTIDEPKTTETLPELKNSPKVVTTITSPAVNDPSTVKASVASETLPNVSTSIPSTVSVIILPQTSTATTTSTVISTSVLTLESVPAMSTSAPSQSTTSTNSLFSVTTSTPIIFGQASLTTTAGVFGQTLVTNSNIFGNVCTTSTTSIFCSTTSSTNTTNIFGSSVSTKPIFGQPALSPTPTSGSPFGNSSSSMPTTNAFGVATNATSSAPIFGQKPDSITQTANIFGQLLTDSNRSDNIFGSSPTTSTATTNIFSKPKNIFSGAGSNITTPSLFGGTSSSIFPQTTVFGQSTTSSNIFRSAGTSNSFFGQNICSPFGNNTSVTSNQNSFESGGGFGGKPLFGQSLFGQNTSNTFMFGNTANTSLFGGSSPSGGGSFQTTTTSSFGSTSGPFSSGKESVAESGFRATNSFQKPLGGFGSAPVFGGAVPAFGAAPTFSSSSTFGSQPTFGSRPFDSSQGSFTQAQGHSNTFENLANQNTIGFGNLAQQSKSQSTGFGTFGSTPAFENKPAFGGSSFSNWRS